MRHSTEDQPLITGVRRPNDETAKQEFVRRALKSECASHVDKLFKEYKENVEDVNRLKKEMFEKVYENMGDELEPEDLARALVVRNERFGKKTSWALIALTLGLFLVFRPRDDDIVLVMTKDGTLVKLRVDRAPCCPQTPSGVLLVFLRYMAILFSILIMPNLVYLIVTGESLEQELHDLHIEIHSPGDVVTLVRKHYVPCTFALALFLLWMCSLIPHDYRDRHRRRQTVREVAVGQFTISGCTCRRRSNFKLFFGKYPPQLMLDLVGTLDNGRAAGTIPPADLSTVQRINASTLIVGLSLFLTFVTGMDTFFAWMDRSISLEHFAKMQKFCKDAAPKPNMCTPKRCEAWAIQGHIGVSTTFCSAVSWTEDQNICVRFGKQPPCCGGCANGGFSGILDEGMLAAIKSGISLVADTGSIFFTLVAASFALQMATTSDSIDVLIKRRSKSQRQAAISNFDLTVPLALDFMETVFGKARTHSLENRSQKHKEEAESNSNFVPAAVKATWSGINNYTIDHQLRDWEDFFHKDLLAPPDTRWTSRLKIPRRCLGISEDEEIRGAWVELPLLPPPMTLWEFMTGGLWRALLPFGKTRHAVIVTDQRLFYVRHRRPSLPLECLGTDLRIDAFRHDHDVIYGRMDRTKLSFLNRMVHQKLLFEDFLPGRILMQTKFGALEINRNHGDALDVYHLVLQLSRNTSGFISKDAVSKAGINWDRCQEVVKKSLTRDGRIWKITPQSDDKVVPVPDVYLSDAAKELIVFHLTLKDLDSFMSGTYTNTDIIVTTGRILFWSRKVYKKFDCAALPCWLTCWLGCLNPIYSPKNLSNSMSFFTLPSILSFSTDLSVDPASWLNPHHTPLKVPCIERCCAFLTRKFARDARPPAGSNSCSCCPRRSGASAKLLLMWRLKQSAHADDDMLVLFTIKPHMLEETSPADAEDVLEGLGYVTEDPASFARLIKSQEHQLETLRKIMCVVQDSCNTLSDKLDELA